MGPEKRKRAKNLTREQKDLIVRMIMNPEFSKLNDLVKEIDKQLWHQYRFKLKENYLKKRLIPQLKNQLKERLLEDKVWCIGSNESIMLEAMPAVIAASKQAQIMGKVFSVREAKWCAKLSSLINDTRTLLSVASGYANREIIHEAVGKRGEPFDTTNLDKVLAMEPWELATACLTREIRPLDLSIPKFEIKPKKLSLFNDAVPYEPMTIFEPLRKLEIAPDILERQAHEAETSFILLRPGYRANDIDRVIRIPIPKGFGKQQFRDMRVSMRESLNKLKFTQEQMRVYTMWLKHLAAGPRVQRVGAKSRSKMIYELREWVKNHVLAKDSRVLLPFSPEGVGIGDTETMSKILDFNLEPDGLLKKVGYEG